MELRLHPADGSVSRVEVTRVAEGLWRWTASHPDWKPRQGWEREVGCVYWEEGDEAIVLVDPLVPADAGERERFFSALDRDVERAGLPVVVLLTCAWHARSSDELVERYGGRLVTGSDGELPSGVDAVGIASEPEWVVWLEDPATLVPGDVLLGTAEGLELCPASWLESRSRGQLARELEPLLDLPAERVLTSHGPPVLSGARDVLARLLARYAPA